MDGIDGVALCKRRSIDRSNVTSRTRILSQKSLAPLLASSADTYCISIYIQNTVFMWDPRDL